MRYADDILIFASSRKGAERRLEQAVKLLEAEMGLTVNKTKTHITSLTAGVAYLGVSYSIMKPVYWKKTPGEKTPGTKKAKKHPKKHLVRCDFFICIRLAVGTNSPNKNT